MEDTKIYCVIEILDGLQKEHGERFSYSFTIDTAGISRYKMSLYYKSETSGIQGAYSISTSDLSEIMEKIQGIFDKCEL